jgi:hypothetical protein
MREISENEYIRALVTIDQYHFQEQTKKVESLTPIKEWTDSRNMSNKLKSALLYNKYYNHQPVFTYVEEITKERFLNLRNIGQKTWDELEKFLNDPSYLG